MKRSLHALLVATMGLWAAPLFGQTSSDRIELGGGANWLGASSFPAVDATQASPGGGRRVVFRSRSMLDASIGVGVRVGFALTPVISVESGLSLNNTTLSTRISDDVEGAPDVTISEPVTQYLVEGGVLVRPRRWRAGRIRPFVSGGGGYLRQLNDGQTLAQTGRSWYFGGGAHYRLLEEGTGRIKSSGLRLDLRASILDGGVAIDHGRHLLPMLGAAVYVGF